MATYPLDKAFAIVDLFDSGSLKDRDEANVQEIAAALGMHRNSISRSLVRTGFTLVQNARVLQEWIPQRYEPPRRWPDLKPEYANTRTIRELYDSGQWVGRCYARDLAQLCDLSEDQVGRALKRLKFRVVIEGRWRRIGETPPVWRRPKEWPPLIAKQRELRKSLGTYAVMRATDLSAAFQERRSARKDLKASRDEGERPVVEYQVFTSLFEDAIDRVVRDGGGIGALYKQGVLTEAIREAIRESYTKARVTAEEEELDETDHDLNYIARQELADWLGERSDAARGYLETRVRGYLRFASMRICPHCGRDARTQQSHHRAETPID